MQTVVPVLFTLAILGALGVAVAMFVKTPAEYRFKISSREYAEQQREEELRSGVAVVIEAQPRRAFIRLLSWAVVLLPLLAFGLYLQSADNLACESIAGISSAYLAVLGMSHVMPITLMLWSVGSVPWGLKVLREGYFPPLDTVSFVQVVARKGAMSRLRGYVIVAMPLLAVFVIYLGHNAYEGVMKGRSYVEFQSAVSRKCITIRSSGRP